MAFVQNSFLSFEQVAGNYISDNRNVKVRNNESEKGLSFKEIYQQTSERTTSRDLIFSKHANERLATRNINLSESQLIRLNEGVRQAKEKSINESLVMMDNIAFIVNVKNNTVITAMDQETNDNNVFTNIDGAVIV